MMLTELSLLTITNYLGIFVFGMSGALAAARKQMDIFGYVVVALLPAVGGGTIRDLVLDAPVFWVQQSNYILVAVSAGVFTYVISIQVGKRYTVLEWVDAIGMSLFCVLGTAKAYMLTNDPVIAVTLGVVTAVAGGILRDIVCMEIPLILKREIYATPALLGAICYCICLYFDASENAALVAGGALTFSTRALAMLFSWSLPVRERR